MELVDELGSVVRNIHKYGKKYFGYEPKIIEEDIFKIVFRIKDPDTQQADDRLEKLIIFCKIPRTRQEMQEFINIKGREYFREKILNPLIENKIIMLTIPDKQRSPKQKYYTREQLDD